MQMQNVFAESTDWLRERNDGACSIVLKPDSWILPTIPIQDEKTQAIKKVAQLISKIVDLKFKAAEFLDENRELYGDFKSAEMQVNDLKAERVRIEELRTKRESWLQERIVELSRISNGRAQKKLAEQIREEYQVEVERLRKSDDKLAQDLLKVQPHYYQFWADWSPYEDYLIQYTKLESELIESLNKIKMILPESKEGGLDLKFAGLSNVIETTPIDRDYLRHIDWRLLKPFEREKYCLDLYKKWQNLVDVIK